MNAVMLDAVLDELHEGTPVPVTEVGTRTVPIQLAA
jgi:hypothetical protein